jgi:hypothetical protein
MNNTEEPERDLESSLEDKQTPTTVQHDEIVGQWGEKTGVAKGDDSDGHVNWTWKQILATISLCGVYVGRTSLYVMPSNLEFLLMCPFYAGSQIPLYFVGGKLAGRRIRERSDKPKVRSPTLRPTWVQPRPVGSRCQTL